MKFRTFLITSSLLLSGLVWAGPTDRHPFPSKFIPSFFPGHRLLQITQSGKEIEPRHLDGLICTAGDR